MKTIIIIALLFSVAPVFGQNVTREQLEKELRPWSDRIRLLQSDNARLKSQINVLHSTLRVTGVHLNDLRKENDAVKKALARTSAALDLKIRETGKSGADKIRSVDHASGERFVFGLIAILLTAALSAFCYGVLHRRQKSGSKDIMKRIDASRGGLKTEIEEKVIHAYDLLLGSIAEQLAMFKVLIEELGRPDHQFALKLIDNVYTMRMNLDLMDQEVSGYKQLMIAINGIFKDLKAHKYELVALTGLPYSPGDNIIVRAMKPAPDLTEDEKRVGLVMRPQVNYEGKLLQAAEAIIFYGQ